MPKPYNQPLKERLNREYAIYGGHDKFISMLKELKDMDLGQRDAQIADQFRVAPITVMRWRKEFSKMDPLSGANK